MNEEGKFLAGQPLSTSNKAQRRSVQRPAQLTRQQVSNRRLRKLSLGVLIICAVIWSWQKLTNPQTLPVRTIRITGSYTQVNQALLRQVILPYVSKGFLWADTAALQDRLQQLPWIYTATVKRVWPNNLVINLVQQKPVARINGNILVNEQGDTFEVNITTIPAGLPLFVKPVQSQQKLILQNYQAMSAILAPLAVKIMAISLDASQSWSLQLDNGIVLIVGKIDPLQHLQRFVQVYPQIIGANAAAISNIDLRYANGVAVRFKSQNKN